MGNQQELDMNQDEYLYKLKDALNSAVRDSVDRNPTQVIRGFQFEVERVTGVDSIPNIENIKLHRLLSGEEIEVNVSGTIGFFQKITDGAKGRESEFWIRPAKVKFDDKTERFVVIDIAKFMVLDFTL